MVRDPVKSQSPEDEAIKRLDCDRSMMETARGRGLVALLKSMKPLDEEFPDIDDPAPGR